MLRYIIAIVAAIVCLPGIAQRDYRVTNFDEITGTPQSITQILQDRHGLIWVSNVDGLSRYDGYEWRNYKSRCGDGTRLKTNRVKHIYLSAAGNIWCLISGHAILFDLNSYRFIDVLADYEQRIGQELTISKIRTLTNGSTWFITDDGTLLTVGSDTTTEVSRVWQTDDDRRTTLFADEKGLTWILTLQAAYTYNGHALKKQKGSPLMGTKTETKTKTVTDSRDYPEIDSGDYHITDSKGNIWFIHNGELMQLSFDRKSFQRLPLPHPCHIRGAMKDREGRLWLSDRTNGYLMLFSPSLELLGYIGTDGCLTSSAQPFADAVYSMLQDRFGNIWLGTRGSGLYRLQAAGATTFRVTHYTKDNSTLNDHKIYEMRADRQGRIWIGTDLGGPNCIPHPQDEEPRFLNGDHGLKGYLPSYSRKNYTILPTHDDRLLVGTVEGLFVADISGNSLERTVFKEHQREAHRKSSLGSSCITSLVETADHRVFVGTQGGGVNEVTTPDLMADQLEFRHYDAASGLFTDLPVTLFSTQKGRLWIVGAKQLTEVCYDRRPLAANDYVGREHLEFTNVSPIPLADGQWLFGLEDGAAVIKMDELKKNSYVPPIVVTDVVVEGENVGFVPHRTDTIMLAPGQRNATITFAALDYVSPLASRQTPLKYAFRMNDGQPWNYISDGGHSVTLANLEPGTYRLTLHSTNADGQWVDNERVVTIIVKPTFWQTGWAKLLIVLIILSIAALIAYTLLYIRRIKRQQRETLEAYMGLLEVREVRDEKVAVSEAPAPVAPAPSASTPDLSPEDDSFMKRLMNYIEENIGNSDASPEDMADATATSRSSLNRKVHRLVGMTPMEFMREARMRKACQLLQEGHMAVNDIAYACGFSDPKYFSKCFKQTTGQTPTQYKDAN